MCGESRDRHKAISLILKKIKPPDQTGVGKNLVIMGNALTKRTYGVFLRKAPEILFSGRGLLIRQLVGLLGYAKVESRSNWSGEHSIQLLGSYLQNFQFSSVD